MAFIIAQKIKDETLMAKLYNLAGALAFSKGDYAEALKQYTHRLNINITQKDTSGMLGAYYNISLIYNARSEHRKTIEVSYKAMELAEKTKDTFNLMGLNEGLGMAYHQLDEPEKAISFLNKAYRLSVIKKEAYSQTGLLIDFGNIYQKQGNHSRAIRYYDEAIMLSKRNSDKRRQSIATSNKAMSLTYSKEYANAIIHVEEAIKINEEINYVKGLADAYSVKSECLFFQNKLEEAKKWAERSTEISLKIKARREEYQSYQLLSKIYEAMKDNAKAFYYYKRFVNLRDSIDSKEEIRAVSGIEFGYEKEKIERRKKYEQELAANQLQKQKQIQNIILIAGLIMLGLLFFILRSFVQKQKANIEIRKQHEIIEQKNKDILEGINYSRKIQEAILAPEENIRQLLADAFVLYKPKDIVSGDFYFIEPIFPQSGNEKWVAVALADCTGHGVPGALMSLTGYNILKQSLSETNISGPGQALDFLNTGLHHFLKQNQKEQQIRDGMDISFCAINFEKNLLMFSGANNPLWIISRNGNKKNSEGEALKELAKQGEFTVYEIKANKQPIGFSEKTEKFVNHTIELQKGDMIYLLTDGFADQFGGLNQEERKAGGKKFKYKPLRQIITDNANKKMTDQKQALEIAFENWKGELEQVDDVSIIGIKI